MIRRFLVCNARNSYKNSCKTQNISVIVQKYEKYLISLLIEWNVKLISQVFGLDFLISYGPL